MELSDATAQAKQLALDAVAASGAQVLEWRTRQVDHRPGSSCTVSYRAHLRWPDGHVSDETVCVRLGPAVAKQTHSASDQIHTGSIGETQFVRHSPARGGHRIRFATDDARVWQFPDDPFLPCLPNACDLGYVGELFAKLRIRSHGSAALELKTVSYRPSRRAVIEARQGKVELFLKVVRPDRLHNLYRRHLMLTEAGLPTPAVLDWDSQGLLVLGALRGQSMREAVRMQSRLPKAGDFIDLLDRLPAQAMELPYRKPWSASAAWYAQLIGAALPQEATRASQLADEISGRIAGLKPNTATHGDFYEAQLRVARGRIVGLLDVDTMGPGRRAEDLGCLLAHLNVLSIMSSQADVTIDRMVQQYDREFVKHVDPVELHTNAAGVMLSLATGPHRVQEANWPEATRRRLDAVERWLA